MSNLLRQVAEWMGRREAWSAEKSSDSRTKPTRWEFSRRINYNENIGGGGGEAGRGGERDNRIDDEFDNSRRKVRSADERRIRVKNIHTTKDSHFHNSRTNLINDRDVYMEDIDEQHHQNRAFKSQTKSTKYVTTDDRNIDDDSMRRHEIDRGSDIDYGRSSFKRNEDQKKNRELYIKDGNAEILQLMTRDKQDDENIYVNLPTTKATTLSQPHLVMLDNSGKEILMRRFIEEQPDGKQIIREHYQIVPGATYIQTMPNEIQQPVNVAETFVGKSGPNSVVYSQVEPEIRVIHTQPTQVGMNVDGETTQIHPADSTQSLHRELETSLKQQNALLRQILLEKEKLEERYSQQEVALETQSLPCQSMAIGTQTDCEAGTQTDFPYEGRERRKARSENDDSMSEDEYEYVRYSPPNSPDGVYWIKRKRQKKKSKYRTADRPRKRVVMVEEVKRKIRTPIKEENEEVVEHQQKKRSPPKKHAETKTSMLRRMKNGVMPSKPKLTKTPPLNKDILMEISDSLDEHASPDVKEKRKHSIRVKEVAYYEDSDNNSDGDEIVIRRNTYSEGGSPNVISDGEEEPEHRFEIHVTDSRNKIFSRQGSSTEKREEFEREYQRRYAPRSYTSDAATAAAASKPRLSRKDSKSEKDNYKRRQTASEPPFRSTKGPAPKPPDIEQRKGKRPIDEKTYSEADLVDKLQEDEDLIESSKGVPRYMDWYYSKKKTGDNDKSKSEDQKSDKSSKSKPGAKKIIGGSEKKIKSRMSKAEEYQQPPEGKYKPEPMPRKSPPKGARLLKEDMVTNKNLKPRIETDTNHPLLQHSEHRFEREYDQAPEIPIPPTKLPHYMYPETPPFVSTIESKKSSSKAATKPKPSPIKENEVSVSKSKSKTTIYIEDPQQHHSTSSQQTQSKQLNVSTLEDDHDSGIAMNSLLNSMGRRNPIADKKSVFTIAYDDVSKVKKIQSGSDSPQLS